MRSKSVFLGAAVAACLSVSPLMAAEQTSRSVIRQAALDTGAASVSEAPAAKPMSKPAAKKAMRPASRRLVAQIDLSSQSMNITIDGQVAHSWKISSGANGYHTPTGTYTPYQLSAMHYSKKYDNAPMPHSVFFRGGFAIHATGATGALGRPASHGCIRLHPSNASAFFSLVKQYGKSNTQIRITGATPASRSLYAGRPSRSTTSSSSYSWSGFNFGVSDASSSYTRKRTGVRIGDSRMTTRRQGKRIVHTWW